MQLAVQLRVFASRVSLPDWLTLVPGLPACPLAPSTQDMYLARRAMMLGEEPPPENLGGGRYSVRATSAAPAAPAALQEDDMESLDFQGEEKPWYKKKTFWRVAGPLAVSLAFLVAGILYLTLSGDTTLGDFQARAVGRAALPCRVKPVHGSPLRAAAAAGVPWLPRHTRAVDPPLPPHLLAGLARLLLRRRPAHHLVDWPRLHEHDGVGGGEDALHAPQRGEQRGGARETRTAARPERPRPPPPCPSCRRSLLGR